MRIAATLLAGCLFGTLFTLTTSSSALGQELDHMPLLGRYARRPPVYPNVRTSPPAYFKAIKYGLPPVLPPAWTRGPLSHDGRGLYDPPCYAYPRPPLGHQGYAGFGGGDPNAYHAVIPPPIPPVIPHASTPASSNAVPTAPMPPGEQIPTPPSDPGNKS
jgi:hypothetical protein